MMTTIPIPFLTAFLLLLLAGSSHQQLKATASGRAFALCLYLTAMSMVCIGFRWSYDLTMLMPIAAVLSVISASVLYLAFCSLGRRGPVITLVRDWPHLIPILLIAAASLFQPRWAEFLLIATKFVYAGLLLQLAMQAPASVQFVRLNWVSHSQQALWGSAMLLLLSAGVDAAIIIDFALYEGRHAAKLVGFANLFVVLLLGWVCVVAGRGKATDITEITDAPAENNYLKPEPNDTSTEDAQLLNQLNNLLVEQALYADTELNLQKLARKVGVPARQVSRAINNQTGKNVSQWVNSARVDAACTLLSDKNISVTQAMLDAGFLTKSNFNREFKRLKGSSPSQWREEHA